MANVTLKHLFDHGVSDAEWLDAHSAVAASPLYIVYATVCRACARALLSLACLPLLTIRQMPAPLHSISALRFYYPQWIDDLKHIRSSHYKVMFAFARLIDSIRLAIAYGMLTAAIRRYICRGRLCDCSDCRGQCKSRGAR